MKEFNFTPFPRIITNRLILRQVSIKDANEIFILKSDDDVLKFLDKSKTKTIDEIKQFIDKVNTGIANNQWILWGITLKGSTSVVGTICIWNISEHKTKADIGYEMIPEYHGRGIMQESLEAIIKYGIERMGLTSLEAVTHPNNVKSVKLLERNNFTKISDINETSTLDGKEVVLALYALSSRDD